MFGNPDWIETDTDQIAWINLLPKGETDGRRYVDIADGKVWSGRFGSPDDWRQLDVDRQNMTLLDHSLKD